MEVGETSSPPKPLNVSEEINEFVDSDMSDNDDLIVDPENPRRPKWEANTIHALTSYVHDSRQICIELH